MHVSAKADYAMRALVVLAGETEGLTKAEDLAASQGIPHRFLEAILTELRRAGLVESQRGAVGGFRLARPASQIAVADVMRAVDGPLADVRGRRPEASAYNGAAEPLQAVWVAARASLRQVLEAVTLEHVASGHLPRAVTKLTAEPDAWSAH